MVEPRQTPLRRELDRHRTRRGAGPPTWGRMPELVGRGRTTLRHFLALLCGGYVSSVRARRERGARGPLFGIERFTSWVMLGFLDRELARQPFPAQLRARLEALGPTYIKLGQILSLRRDLLPEIVTDELQNLLAFLPPVPFEDIRAIVERDLQRPLEEVFTSVDPTPLGSASIAQTHRATTSDGRDAILKVVKPGIRELLERDVALLRGFAVVLEWVIPGYRPRHVMEEFFEYTLREIDMRLEAGNAEVFAANFRDAPDIVFPEVYADLSGESVLCMQFLDGIQPDLAAAQSLSEEERGRLIDRGAEAIIRMLYQDGFFHADLHPGNLFILPGAKVGFVDLGMVGRLDAELRRHLLYMYYAMVMEDFESAARHLAEVAETGQRSDLTGFRQAVKELCRRWRRAATFEEFSLALLVLESVRLGARFRVYFPVEMVLMVKALVTYEGVGYMLDPDFNVAEVSERHVGRIFRQTLSPRRLLREGVRGAPEVIEAMVKLPMLISESLRLLERRSRQSPDRPTAGLRGTVLGGFLMLAGAILTTQPATWIPAVALLAIGALVALRRDW